MLQVFEGWAGRRGEEGDVLDVRPSAWMPPGVRVKFSLMQGETLGRLVSGSAGRKRMRWSRALEGVGGDVDDIVAGLLWFLSRTV